MEYNNLDYNRAEAYGDDPIITKLTGTGSALDTDVLFGAEATPTAFRLEVDPGKQVVTAFMVIGMLEMNLSVTDENGDTYTILGGPQGFNTQLIGPNKEPMLGITSLIYEISAKGRVGKLTYFTEDGEAHEVTHHEPKVEAAATV